MGTRARVRHRALRWLAAGLLGFVPVVARASDDDLAARVVVVANAVDPESVALGRAYLARRGIPSANLALLPMSPGESIEWPRFVVEIFNPLQAWLVERGWIDAIAMDLHDDAGRRKLAVSGHRIAFLVLCRGVPLRLEPGAGLPPDAPATAPAEARTARAAVDSELALLAQNATRRDGFVPNPLHGRPQPGEAELAAVIRVARLDGPDAAAALALVDQALAAERVGLLGRAYVDLGGPHAIGDRWLEATAQLLAAAGWDPAVDRERASLPPTARGDAAAWYFGWYDERISGPFAAPGYRFPPGAIALHIHSTSAASLRERDGGGWCGPLVARGVTATFGNVHEPYLEFTHRPDLLVAALLRGATLGEAAYEALPVLSWQSIVVGDPLYRPLRVPLADQLARWRELPSEWSGYAVLREVQALERRGESATALARLRMAWREAPSLALAVALAERQIAAEDLPAAARTLGAVARLTRVRVAEQPLLAEAARLMEKAGAAEEGLQVWQALLDQDLTQDARRAWLEEAIEAAKRAQAASPLQRWRDELAGPTTPTP